MDRVASLAQRHQILHHVVVVRVVDVVNEQVLGVLARHAPTTVATLDHGTQLLELRRVLATVAPVGVPLPRHCRTMCAIRASSRAVPDVPVRWIERHRTEFADHRSHQPGRARCSQALF